MLSWDGSDLTFHSLLWNTGTVRHKHTHILIGESCLAQNTYEGFFSWGDKKGNRVQSAVSQWWAGGGHITPLQITRSNFNCGVLISSLEVRCVLCVHSYQWMGVQCMCVNSATDLFIHRNHQPIAVPVLLIYCQYIKHEWSSLAESPFHFLSFPEFNGNFTEID